MSTVTKSENTKLFREAEMLRKSIQSEIHSAVRNEPDTVETLHKKTSNAEKLHNKPIKKD
ncbi:hypothetical protein A3Q33_00135 [Colwellia sp. PAMC 21821]|nr:hypothetical protein A3Q33_00135 [Colwellia sp. PAMC 21821]